MPTITERNQRGKLPGALDGEPVVPENGASLVEGITDPNTQVVAGYQSVQGPYVHVGTVWDAEVYITAQTVREAAGLLNYMAPEKAQELLEIAEGLARDVERLTAELEEARTQQTRVVDAEELLAKLAEAGA